MQRIQAVTGTDCPVSLEMCGYKITEINKPEQQKECNEERPTMKIL